MSLNKIYIPRILSGVSNCQIIDVFHQLQIGRIFYIDKHRKVNTNNKVYYFAFLNIEIYNTQNSNMFMDRLIKNGSVQIVYDTPANLYWDVKPYVDKSLRNTMPPRLCKFPTNHCVGPAFSRRERTDLEDEFDELSREIHRTILGAQSYNMWSAPLMTR